MRPLRALRSRSLSVLAAVVLLLGTATPALARMTCLMSGRSMVSLGQADGCCSREKGSSLPVVKATCCALVHAQPQRTAFLSSPAPALPPLEAVAATLVTAPQPLVAEAPAAPTPFSRPPPDTGRRLAVMGTLLI